MGQTGYANVSANVFNAWLAKFVVALPQKNYAFIFLKLSTRVILAAKCNLYLRSKNLQNPHGFNMKRKHQNAISLCSFETNKYHF